LRILMRKLFMDIGTIQPVNIDQQMRDAFIDYAMSVIVARALPDARDGLKPVHRRILYAMSELGLRANSPFKKSARIVGEVLGKYHPHGDSAVYEAMARMAQNFSMRYILVDGQGNFGSIDGDAPAAMRYTEARLHRLAEEMLADIDKNTVDFGPNFDDSLTEPTVLPSRVPNLLLNGTSGIAVGMATNIPPHNLRELAAGIIHLIDNYERIDDITVEDLMKHVSGPDFPTGGIIIGRESILQAYGTGRGRLVVRGMAHIEEMKGGRHQIVITEIPYQLNKSSLIERIADLVREEKLDQISDLRDESDQRGMSIVIELKRGAQPKKVLNQLYKYTALQSTFAVQTLALVNGEPRLLPLKRALHIFIKPARSSSPAAPNTTWPKPAPARTSSMATLSPWPASTPSSRPSARPPMPMTPNRSWSAASTSAKPKPRPSSTCNCAASRRSNAGKSKKSPNKSASRLPILKTCWPTRTRCWRSSKKICSTCPKSTVTTGARASPPMPAKNSTKKTWCRMKPCSSPSPSAATSNAS
jgi:hypothetical protein